ncbi:MAG TPA: succinyl-diaminopimelate desuccinylase [Acidimicrobiales bacterium]
MPDLLQRTADLIAVPSVSLEEAVLADQVEAELRRIEGLTVDRVGDNVVARTTQGRDTRLVLAGHLDTVPPNGNAEPRIEGDTLWGLGAADMKGGLAVMLTLAHEVPNPAVDVTYVFYTGEEVASVHNGLAHLFRDRPDLVAGDVALLGEPTDAHIEAGCQGTMRIAITLTGHRAHTARPWMGRNAIHRAGALLTALASYEARRPVLDGCEFRESVEAVAIEGGVAGNVVPDRVTITVNVRFAPDRSPEEAEAELRALVGHVLEPDDEWKLVDMAIAAPPSLDHPVLAALRDGGALGVRAKLGWTDVARFAAAGIPAANFGPGDPTLAHTPEERVERASLDAAYRAVRALLTDGAAR